MASSSSTTTTTSPFSTHRPLSPDSSTSSSHITNRLIPRSSSTSASSSLATPSLSMTHSHSLSDSGYIGSGSFGTGSLLPYPSEELLGEPMEDTLSSERDSISVTVRFRPLSDREYQRGDEVAWYPDGDTLVRHEYNPLTAYAFDKVFGPQATTIDVYDVAARPVVKAAMEGVNGTVFAYGVTSSGKTHTMHGDQEAPGIIPLAIKDVFSIIQDTPGREFLLRVSYLEIYNEVINDLLDPTGQNLRVREDSQGTYVEGIKEEVVLSPGHALSFIAAGEEHRHVGSNNFNLMSSRSHTIFTLMVESSATGDEYDGVIFSQLNLIDLAGSESSKTETTGLRRKEGSYINKSLLTLGTVIGKLSEGRATHIPYRDSKLTRLLQSSLSGHGHVSLICTITPASSSNEETHNTLKFASRAKSIEIYASRNQIIDEKSLIKKYQREISTLKLELDQLRRGTLVGVSHEELMSLKQQLEEGQVKMQSRLEEEEEAKAALMSRIQKLTKLILVSTTKNSVPGYLGDVLTHKRSLSAGDKLDSLLLDNDNQGSPSSTLARVSDASLGFNHRRTSSKLNGQNSPSADFSQGAMTSDEIDLLVELVKMLAGEIAFSTSTLKRLVDQSVNDPENSQTQVQNLEREIQEKQRQMRALEKLIIESAEASFANASLVEMQQKIMSLMTQCNEKSFELEIKSADNCILQEQLRKKCIENKELYEKVIFLEQRLNAVSSEKSSPSGSDNAVSGEYADELKKKIQSQEIKNEKLKLEHVQIVEENSGLRVADSDSKDDRPSSSRDLVPSQTRGGPSESLLNLDACAGVGCFLQNVERHEKLTGQQVNHEEEMIKLQLDLDVLKMILQEERTLRGDTDAHAVRLKLYIGELKSQLCTKTETISRLQEKLQMAERKIYEASNCATASLALANRYAEVVESHNFELKQLESQLEECAAKNLSLKQHVQDEYHMEDHTLKISEHTIAEMETLDLEDAVSHAQAQEITQLSPHIPDLNLDAEAQECMHKKGHQSKTVKLKKDRKPTQYWSLEEENMLKVGVETFESQVHKSILWKTIFNMGANVFHPSRTPTDLRRKWWYILKKEDKNKECMLVTG